MSNLAGSEAACGLGEGRMLPVRSGSDAGAPGVDTSGYFLAGFHAKEVQRCTWARPQSPSDLAQ